jgi:hypothetical protein
MRALAKSADDAWSWLWQRVGIPLPPFDPPGNRRRREQREQAAADNSSPDAEQKHTLQQERDRVAAFVQTTIKQHADAAAEREQRYQSSRADHACDDAEQFGRRTDLATINSALASMPASLRPDFNGRAIEVANEIDAGRLRIWDYIPSLDALNAETTLDALTPQTGVGKSQGRSDGFVEVLHGYRTL